MEEEFHHSPISAHCEDVLKRLEEGQIPCEDFRMARSAVMCKAFALLEEGSRKKLPVSEAWAYLRTKCRI